VSTLILRAVAGPFSPQRSGVVGKSRGRHESRRISRRRSRPPSSVKISLILGEVEVRYVSDVRLLRIASGAFVSRAVLHQRHCLTARGETGSGSTAHLVDHKGGE
jgi:hypothetical protein